MADGEQIHSAMWPGSFAGDLFARQIEVSVRNHALESGCFVVNATGWLDADQRAQIGDTAPRRFHFRRVLHGDRFAQGEIIGEPLRSGEGEVIADLDFSEIDRRKAKMDSRGHYSRRALVVITHRPLICVNGHGRIVSGRTEW